MRPPKIQRRHLWFLLIVAISAKLYSVAARTASNTPRDFVVGFYHWYLPYARKNDALLAGEVVVQRRPEYLSGELRKRLQDEANAQQKCHELVSIDFDPFLAAQDPDGQYEVGAIHQTVQAFHADVYRTIGGHRNNKPDVIAEFEQSHGQWFFTNFRYPGSDDLITMLKSQPRCTVPRRAGEK